MNHKGKDPPLVHRKVALLGFRSVGKTSIVNSFTTGTFSDTYDSASTYGLNSHLHVDAPVPTIETHYNKTLRFRKVHFSTDIVDTAGMDEYSRLSRNASLGVHGYALVFSIVSRASFVQISQLNDLLINTHGDAPDLPRVLVGSMSDLAEQQRQVNYNEAQELAASWGVPYIECSSRTGENVADVFHTLVKEIEKDDGFLLAEAGEGGCCIL